MNYGTAVLVFFCFYVFNCAGDTLAYYYDVYFVHMVWQKAFSHTGKRVADNSRLPTDA